MPGSERTHNKKRTLVRKNYVRLSATGTEGSKFNGATNQPSHGADRTAHLGGTKSPIPEIDEDSALLRVEACGTCGSDYEQYEGVIRAPMPAVPGHEPLGIVEAIGDRAARCWGVDVGDRIAVETMLSCRFCSQCLGGRYHLCDERRIYSYIPLSDEPGLWGAYSEYMFVHGNSIVHKMDKDLAPEIAVMFNP